MIESGADASTIRNALMPLRAIYREAIDDGLVAVSPLTGLKLPKVRGKRDRIASVREAEALIAALPEADRALWATAFYAGLRLGELRGLRWEEVDLAAGRIHVERSWDPEVGEIEPKSDAGTRTVPMAGMLRERLIEHRMRITGSGFVFPRDDNPQLPFAPNTISQRARRTWEHAGLDGLTLHEGRHTAASYFSASGCNLKAVSIFMGHSSVTLTADRYGHLFPGAEDEAAELLDAYFASELERAEDAARDGEPARVDGN